MAPGTLFVVATPIGNLEDITVRALRVLREVSLIAAEDTRHTARLLQRHAIDTPTTSLHEHNEAAKSASLVARLVGGQTVALVSDAGSPTISDPGRRLVAAAAAAGVRVEPIPGPSAVIAALTVSGLGDDTFAFLGFPPIRAKDRERWLRRAREIGGTIVFFEAPHRIERTLADLRQAVGDCEIVLARELTKTHEELVKGPISSVLRNGVTRKGEFTVVAHIGQSAEYLRIDAPDAPAMLLEFGRMTDIGGLTRRQAIARLSQRYGLPTNAVYRTLETAKKSV
jgi:16S rRNA (cytidine1402-2'-O)-methyltransferase